MCLIAFALNPNPFWRLVLAANRDEYLDRPTAPLAWWPDGITAGGRDLRVGGSWMALSKTGRFAAVTNIRLGNKANEQTAAADVNSVLQSRGSLVSKAVASNVPNQDLLNQLSDVGPCNLLWGDLSDRTPTMYFSSNQTTPTSIKTLDSSHCYGLSNADLDTSWPKTSGLKSDLLSAIAQHSLDTKGLSNDLFSALSNAKQAADNQLPATGVSLTMERTLSARFIATSTYGTRSSSVILIDHRSNVLLIERSWDHAAKRVDQLQLDQPMPYVERTMQFQLNGGQRLL